MSGHLWTQQLIADLIEKHFGVKYHHYRVGRILKRIGFTHQKPARRAKERDEAKIQQWRQEVWPELLKKCRVPRGDSDGRRGRVHDDALRQAHSLPPYAPDLNAVEGVWSLSKYHRMANHTIDTLDALHAEAACTPARWTRRLLQPGGGACVPQTHL